MVKLVDNLQAKILSDRYLFFAFAAGGSVLILLAKIITDWRMEWIALGAIALMLAYAFLVTSSTIGKMREDQAGDNCYYLGLIYTLTSLAYAIFVYDPESTASAIVNGFGVALATTILGLVLRVFFNQSRLDIHELEGQTRLELIDAANEMKAQLAGVTNTFADFGHQLHQSMDELRAAAVDSVKEASERSIQAVEDLATVTSEGLTSQTVAFKDQVSELTEATTSSKKALERHAKSLEKLTEQQAASAENLEMVREAVEATKLMSEQVQAQQKATAELQVAIDTVAKELASNTGKLGDAVGTSISSLTSLTEGMGKRIQEIEVAPKQTLDAALNAIARAAERLEETIRQTAAKQVEINQGVETSVQGVVRALAGHNEALDAELSKSRENVTKVHTALVDMTNDLREQVKQGANG